MLGEATALAASVVIALLLTTVVQMVVGELVPKSVAVARPLPTTLGVAGPFRWYAVVFWPVIAVCNASANGLLRLFGVEPTEELSSVRSREELRRLVRTSEEGGTIRSQTADLLDRSFRFGSKTAADALTPRVEVRALHEDAEVGDLMDLSVASGLSRFPVHGGDLDRIIGVVHVKEVLGLPRERRRTMPLSVLVRPVAIVPETKPLDELLEELQGAAAHLAVVLDEYGGTAGIITVEDLVEEIVGDIVDEHDPHGARARGPGLGRRPPAVGAAAPRRGPRRLRPRGSRGGRTRRWPGSCWTAWAASPRSARASSTRAGGSTWWRWTATGWPRCAS